MGVYFKGAVPTDANNCSLCKTTFILLGLPMRDCASCKNITPKNLFACMHCNAFD